MQDPIIVELTSLEDQSVFALNVCQIRYLRILDNVGILGSGTEIKIKESPRRIVRLLELRNKEFPTLIEIRPFGLGSNIWVNPRHIAYIRNVPQTIRREGGVTIVFDNNLFIDIQADLEDIKPQCFPKPYQITTMPCHNPNLD